MNARKWMLLLAAACGLGLAWTSAQAQDAEVAPPDRVARLAVIDGSAELMPAGSDQWGSASINRPLTTGDRLWVPEGSRASLELGGTEIRLDGDSAFGFLHLGNQTAQAQLTSGTLNLNVRHLYSGQDYEIDTPTLAFVADRRGQFRIDIAPDGKGTQVTVFSGEARVYGQGGAERRVSAGNSYRFYDDTLAQVGVFAVPAPDGFDRWCFARDARYQRDYGRTAEYVSREVIGYQDLADYGSWQNETDYGSVWFPTAVPVGWAPYRYGHWAWVPPWGWTWIDDAPWGFAPFHYGRWVWVGDRWGWVPGPLIARPVYAPALVAFVGFGNGGWGGGWNAGFGFGGPVGWYPLGPGAVFVPWYRCGPRYFRNVNITNINIVNQTVINNINTSYRVWQRNGPLRPMYTGGPGRLPPHALTVVPQDVFVHARQVGPHIAQLPKVPMSTVLHAPLGAPPAPVSGSLMARNHGPMGSVPRPLFNRNVLAHRPPPHAIDVFPPHLQGYRVARGTVQQPQVPMRPLPIAQNVRVIGAPQTGRPARGTALQPALPGAQSGERYAPRGTALQPSMPVAPRAGIGTAQRPGVFHAPQNGALPSAGYAPHRWQARGDTLPTPPHLQRAPVMQAPAPQNGMQIRREGGVEVITGHPREPGGNGSFSVMGGGGAPPTRQRGDGFRPEPMPQAPRQQPYVGERAARTPESGGGMQMPPPRYEQPMPRPQPNYPRAPDYAPQQPFHRMPAPHYDNPQPQPYRPIAPQPPRGPMAEPPAYRPPPREFRAPPPRQAPQREEEHPPHGGGRPF